MAFKKGQSGNPKGRPTVVIPEVQRAVDANKNAVKVLILQKIEPKVEKWIERIIETGIKDGDAQKFRMLLEIVFGKIPEAPPEFMLSEEEKLLVHAFRDSKRIEHRSDPVPEPSRDGEDPTKVSV